MPPNSTSSIQAIYTERSPTYDTAPFHPRQAAEYIHLANLTPGQSVLDLACGTGLVTIPAKRCVRSSGKVIGVDLSSGMLDIARQKTSALELDITYFEHDIADLGGLELGEFDVITCASALLLLRDPLGAIKHWGSLLAPKGRILVDVMVERNVLGPSILRHIGPEVGRSLHSDSSWVKSEDSLRDLLVDAGLIVEKVYKSDVCERKEYKVEEGAEIFEKTVANPMFRNFGENAVREKAKELFVARFREMAGEDGLVHEEVGFYMGIARKDGSV
ncbi:MAG: hypothetical protein Q9168_002065 [Polycauliona sp. 1 TL-2023]